MMRIVHRPQTTDHRQNTHTSLRAYELTSYFLYAIRSTLYAILISLILPLSTQAVFAMVTEPPSGVSADNYYFKKGLLDVTLYGADPTGQTDSTEAIQKAVYAARDYQLAAFFPNQANGERGVYLVSDTIKCFMQENVIFYNAEPKPNVLVGSTKGAGRPIIKLKENTSKFSSPSTPVPVIWFWAMPGPWTQYAWSDNPLECEDDVSFDQIFKGIDIDLNSNPGAYGIRHAGAQGSTIEDVKIIATGAYAGLGKFGVLGCAIYNVEVEGGQYAVYCNPCIDRLSTYNGHGIMIGCTFKNQEKAVFYLSDRTPAPVLLVGFHIVRKNGVVLNDVNNVRERSGGISLVDGIMEMDGGQIFNDNHNFYMRNVYVKGADSVANNWKIDDKNDWAQIKEYVYTTTIGWGANFGKNLIDGNLNTNEYRAKVENVNVTLDQLINSLVKKHQWDTATFPSFEDSDAIDVKEMGANSAKGDGMTDDTAALRYAIEHYDKIFLSKGKYMISGTLELKSNTQLFGIGTIFSRILNSSSWIPSGETIILTTVDDKNAKTSLSFLSVNTDMHREITGQADGFTPIQWRAGRNSMTRNVMAGAFGSEDAANLNYHRFRINKGGGGRHFSPLGRWRGAVNDINNRGLLIEGTEEPLYIYAFNAAGDPLNINVEIKNAKNVHCYYFTHEGSDTAIRIDQSENIGFFTDYKNNEVGINRGGVEVFDSNNVLVENFVPTQGSAVNQYPLIEKYSGVANVIPNNANVALFKRGDPGFDSVLILYGDVSGDGTISAYDAALTAQAAVSLITLNSQQTQAADVSGDGKVTAYDAALIAQKAVGLIDKFPVEG